MTGPGKPGEEPREPGCQLEDFGTAHARVAATWDEPLAWYVRRRSGNLLRRLAAAFPQPREPTAPRSTAGPAAPPAPAPSPFQAGDRVRVRPEPEIRATLDGDGRLSGCSFAAGMVVHCGREYRVLRVVDRFFDEARFRMLRARNMVLLDGVHCDGSSDPRTAGCARMCFYFWRTEWLERLEP